MKYIRILTLLLCLGFTSVAYSESSGARLLVSVSDILQAEPPRRLTVEVFLRVHEPATIAGVTLLLVGDTSDRSAARAKLPLGSLHVLSVSAATYAKIVEQRAHQERIEKSIDRGTRPEIISDAVALTEFRLTDMGVFMERKAVVP